MRCATSTVADEQSSVLIGVDQRLNSSPARIAGPLIAVLMVATAVVMIQAAQEQQTFPLFVASAVVLGLLQIVAWKQDQMSTGLVLVLAVALRIFAFPTPPTLSDDMYRYVWDGWVVLDGVNPFAYRPSDAIFTSWHGAPLRGLLNSAEFHSVYPPVSQMFFAVGAFLGEEVPFFTSIPGPSTAWWPAWMGIKSLFVLAEMAGLGMLSRHVQGRTLQLIALSPVVLIAGALQGHTDILLLPLLAAGVVAWSRNWKGLAIACISLAGWVKLVPLLLVPFLILGASFRWADRLRFAGIAVLVSVLVWLPFAAPYVPNHMASSLNLYVAWFEFNAGPYYLVKEWYELRTGADWSKQIGPALRRVFLVVYFALLAVTLTHGRRLRFVLDRGGDNDEEIPSWWAWKMGYGAWIAFLLLSTTVHPWYLLGVLVLGIVLFENRIPWHWLFLSVLSVGTYLLYSNGSDPYWWAVRVGWGSWFLLWLVMRSPSWLQAVLVWRADAKRAMLAPWIGAGESVLDVGGGEGYLAQRLSQLGSQRAVGVAEVRAAVRAPVTVIQYDGFVLPCEDNSYDIVIMTYVLHHTESPEQVLREALRVARRRVVVIESTYKTEWERRVLRFLDVLANRLRSSGTNTGNPVSTGSMKSQEEHLDHRTDAAWAQLATELGGYVLACRPVWRPFHRQFLFVTASQDASK